jgi:hypothetical protein
MDMVGLVVAALSLVGLADGRATQAGTPSRSAISASSATAKQPLPASEPARPAVESTAEHGVTVVRHGAVLAGVGSAADQQVMSDQALSALRAAFDQENARLTARPYQLASVRMAENWKYSQPRGRDQTQRSQLWEYKPRRDWTYHAIPERSQEEVKRLTMYRRTLP